MTKTRRQFLTDSAKLGGASLLSSPFSWLGQMIANGFIFSSQAEAAGLGNPRNYINIYHAGGPARFHFDQWVRSNPEDPPLIPNLYVTNKYTSAAGVVNGLEYSTFNYKDLLVPHLFSQSVGTSKGEIPLTQLLDNMLVVRGYSSGFDGHDFNVIAQMMPLGGVPSISGVVADQSNRFFEAIQWPARSSTYAFFSKLGKSMSKPGSSMPAHDLLSAFGATTSVARTTKAKYQMAYDAAQARVLQFSRSDALGADIAAKNLGNASAMIKKGLANLDSYWTPALARYKSILESNMQRKGIAGINDLPVIAPKPVDGAKSLYGILNVNSTFPLENVVPKEGFDIRSAFETMTIESLATGLALAEYVLREGLGSAIELRIPYEFKNIMYIPNGSTVPNNYSANSDMHDSGAYANVLLMNGFYRGLSACILEISQQLAGSSLDGKNLWDETVIHYMGDFGRSARADGTGSDHGFNQNISSFYSGCISGPMCVGNVLQAGYNDTTLKGSQAIAAPIAGYNQAGKPSTAMMASTLTELLRVEKNPFANTAAPLVKDVGGMVQYASFGKGKMVTG